MTDDIFMYFAEVALECFTEDARSADPETRRGAFNHMPSAAAIRHAVEKAVDPEYLQYAYGKYVEQLLEERREATTQ